MNDVLRPAVAEALGTVLLVATVIGSGIMAERLAGGNDAVALLGNTAATAAALYLLITVLGPISGAHFNPAVTLMIGKQDRKIVYILVQIVAAVGGAVLAHLMFGLEPIQTGMKVRTGIAQWLGESVATFGLLLTIVLGSRHRPDAVPALVAAWITAGYWFTSSTSFANPAVTIARSFTNSFSGIRLIDAPGFILAQLAGAFFAVTVANWLAPEQNPG
jgi:glycerol uptake facilitator-like aquaporin